MCPSAVNKSKWLLADCSIGMYDLVAQVCLKTAYACELVLSSEDHVIIKNTFLLFMWLLKDKQSVTFPHSIAVVDVLM